MSGTRIVEDLDHVAECLFLFEFFVFLFKHLCNGSMILSYISAGTHYFHRRWTTCSTINGMIHIYGLVLYKL